MNQSTSIIIPHYEHWDLTHALMSDIYQKERSNVDEIVLVNNGGKSRDVQMGQQYWKDVFGMLDKDVVRIINIPENKGFLLAANLGLIEAKNRLKILISNDVRIHGTFIQEIKNIVYVGDKKKLVGQKFYLTDTGWNKFDRIYPYLEGFFLAADTFTWEDLGYFDIRYTPSDYEDIDLSTEAVSKGYALIPLNFPYIQHTGAGTYGYNPEREKITLVNKEKFRSKWVENGNQH